jgi:hypothetical protein
MRTFVCIIYIILLCAPCFGQATADPARKVNYCKEKHSPLKPDSPLRFDPYYNGHLCESFDPEQIDFSREYFSLRARQLSGKADQLRSFLTYDGSSVWRTGEWDQNGVIGREYQRIRIYIDTVIKSRDKNDTYILQGRSKVNDNICNFTGELKLMKFFVLPCDDRSFSHCGQLFGTYALFEDSSRYHSGFFKGVMECSVHLDSAGNRMLLDETGSIADGYFNRTFVGTWTDYLTGQAKKCIWGDYRLPFTFDFDCGDGEMRVCDKYVNNGWNSFNDQSEIIITKDGKAVLKDKWWLASQKK